MYKLEFLDLEDSTINFTVECSDIDIVLETTTFSDTVDYTKTQFVDYTKYKETGKVTEEEIKFRIISSNVKNQYDEFKKYIRAFDNKFILKVTNGENAPRTAICHSFTEKEGILGYTNFYDWEFSFIRCTRWIEIDSVGFDLEKELLAIGVYNDSDTFDAVKGYAFADSDTFEGMVYGMDNQALNSMTVNLPRNDGDIYAYMRVNVDDCEDGFSFGLNDNADETNEAFMYKDYVSLENDKRNIIDSFPPNRQVTHIRNNGDLINGQADRIFTAKTYLKIPKGDNYLVFKNVRKGSILLYKQFRMPF